MDDNKVKKAISIAPKPDINEPDILSITPYLVYKYNTIFCELVNKKADDFSSAFMICLVMFLTEFSLEDLNDFNNGNDEESKTERNSVCFKVKVCETEKI